MKIKPKILVNSKDSPHISSGYGIIARYLLPILAKRYGKDNVLAVCPVYQRDSVGEYKGIKILPGETFDWSEPLTLEHYKRHKCNILLTIGDIFSFNILPDVAARNEVMWLHWLPVDFLGFPENVRNRLKYIYKIIPFSKWGEKALRDAGFTNTDYAIWPGLNMDIWKPIDRNTLPETMKSLGYIYEKEALNILIVAANQERKQVRRMLEGISIFKYSHPEAKPRLYLHSLERVERDFRVDIVELGLQDITRMPDAYSIITGGLPEEDMVKIYNCADVCINCCLEGFGYAHVHSQSCGVPCIYFEHGAGPELVISGIQVPAHGSITLPNQMTQSFPFPAGIADALDEIWKKKQVKGILRSDKSIQFARENYGWDKIAHQWYRVIDNAIKDYDRYCWSIPPISKKLKEMAEERVYII